MVRFGPLRSRPRGPGDTEGDRWHYLIEKLDTMHEPLAVMAAKKLAGWAVDHFVHWFIHAAYRGG